MFQFSKWGYVFLDDFEVFQGVKMKGQHLFSKIIKNLFVIAGSFFLSILILIIALVTVVFYGPSVTARDILVLSCLETSAMKFVPKLYFSQEQIKVIVASNSAANIDGSSDGDDVIIPTDDVDMDKIEVINIFGPTYVGKLMIVTDPSRVFIGTINNFSEETGGKQLTDIVEDNDAIAGINGGAFEDAGGIGSGGMPSGIVIKDGKIVVDSYSDYRVLIGFDGDHKLVVGSMSPRQAIERGVVEAISFGPLLVLNGEQVKIYGTGGGLNPRTAIGQRADGAILMLVIDGRQPFSLGANYMDVAGVLIEHGAVNAALLDGGASTLMVYKGNILNSTSMLTGPRRIPTAILVSK